MATIGLQKRMNTATAILHREQRKKKRLALKKMNKVRDQVRMHAHLKSRQRLEYHRKTLNWTADTIIEVIRDKILGRIRRSDERNMAAFKLLECPMTGINRAHLKSVLKRRFDLVLTNEEVNMVFERFDSDGSGLLDFHEFINGILPPDYIGEVPITKHALEMTAKKIVHHPDQPIFHAAFDGAFRPSIDAIEKQIRDKIEARTKDPGQQYRLAFQLFGRSNHITPGKFSKVCQRWGIFLRAAELDDLFARYDNDNSGYIEFEELISSVLKSDYPDHGPWHWARAKEDERKKLAQKYGVPPAMLEDHLSRKGLLTRQKQRRKNVERFKGMKGRTDCVKLDSSSAHSRPLVKKQRAVSTVGSDAASILSISPETWGFTTSKEGLDSGMEDDMQRRRSGNRGYEMQNIRESRVALQNDPYCRTLLRTAPSRNTKRFLESRKLRANYTKKNDPFFWKYADARMKVPDQKIMPGGDYSTWDRPSTVNYNTLRLRGTTLPLSKSSAPISVSLVKPRHSKGATMANAPKEERRPSTVDKTPRATSSFFAKALDDALNIAATNDHERRQFSHMLSSAAADKPQFARTNRFVAC